MLRRRAVLLLLKIVSKYGFDVHIAFIYIVYLMSIFVDYLACAVCVDGVTGEDAEGVNCEQVLEEALLIEEGTDACSLAKVRSIKLSLAMQRFFLSTVF